MDVNPSPDELCAQGRQCLYQFTAQSFAGGMRHAERAIQLDPNYAEAHVTLGSLYIVLSQATRAGNPRYRGADLCRCAVTLDPQLAEPQLWLAWAAHLDERFEDAEGEALPGRELDPGGLFSHSVLAWVRLTYGLKTGRWEKCVESVPSFARALEIHPRDVHMPLALASLYRLAEQYCSAQVLLERVGEVERWSPGEMRMIGSLALLGQVHLHRSHLNDARACLLRALSEYSEAPQIYASYVDALTRCGLGDLERREGRYDEAVSHYMQGRALLEAAPALMGCDYVVVRLETRLAGAFRLLRMRRKEELHLSLARKLTATREPYSFNWCWGVSEAELHYDWAVYHGICADPEALLRSIRRGITYGWREASLIDLEPAFAHSRGQSAPSAFAG